MVGTLGYRRWQASHNRYLLPYHPGEIPQDYANGTSERSLLVHTRDANLRESRSIVVLAVIFDFTLSLGGISRVFVGIQ